MKPLASYRIQPSLRCACVAIAVLSLAASAWALPPKPIRDELSGEAASKFDLGVEAAKSDKWLPARDAFLRAWELSRNPRVLFNVAVSEKNLSRFDRAIQFFRMELDAGKGTLTPDETLRVQQNIQALEKFTGTLKLEVSEPGATVLLAEEEIGKTPIDPRIIAPHLVLTVRKTGFETFSKKLDDVGDGKIIDLKVKLEPLQRLVDVEIQVRGVQSASIFVDGNEVGSASALIPYRGKVSVRGEPHSFEARATGFVSSSDSKLASEGQKLNLSFALAKAQDNGILAIDALPVGATIEVDGKVVGSNHWLGPVRIGTRTVKISKDGFYTRTREVTVAAGERRAFSESLDENKNSSWLGWALGSAVVLTGVTVASVFLLSPRTDPISGSLRNAEQTPVETASIRFR
jgi:hypothetical protein